jgi:hypothetical protein
MKWFQHDCSARHDHRIRTLGRGLRAEGVGIYWGLLEEIGRDSETFHLKVVGHSPEADRAFESMRADRSASAGGPFGSAADLGRIPEYSFRILAADLFTTPGRLAKAIAAAVAAGLFDPDKWASCNVLYSPGLARRADNYCRRQRKRTEHLLTFCGVNTDTVRSVSDMPPLQQQDRTEEKDLKKQTTPPALHRMCTDRRVDEPGERFSAAADGDYDLHRRAFRRMITTYNQTAKKPLGWMPDERELDKLFLGGDPRHRRTLCLEASQRSGKETHYNDLVLRALRELLRSHQTVTVNNPAGWLWSCLNGTEEGSSAWIGGVRERPGRPP